MRELTVLHTSDWHLGHQLYRRRRTSEFEAFLDWLSGVVAENSVDVIVIAGDIFDSPLPGPGPQKMYYGFLARAARAGVRHIVVTAGNHDSGALLEVAGDILRHMNIHVIGSVSSDPAGDVRVLRNAGGEPELIVCAAPYLRERDISLAEPGDGPVEREAKLAAGIRSYYENIARIAGAERNRLGADIPILATGHLFAAGGEPGDGVRELYMGTLGHVPAETFPDIFDYVALGHLHRPQKVAGLETRRYSGSPLPMSFDEAAQQKSAILVRFQGRTPHIEQVPVPEFRRLKTVRGSRNDILAALQSMAAQSIASQEEAWVEVLHDGSDHAGAIYDEARDAVAGSLLDILCARVPRQASADLAGEAGRNLEDYTPAEMFGLLMRQQGVEKERQPELLAAFTELVALWHESQREGE